MCSSIYSINFYFSTKRSILSRAGRGTQAKPGLTKKPLVEDIETSPETTRYTREKKVAQRKNPEHLQKVHLG